MDELELVVAGGDIDLEELLQGVDELTPSATSVMAECACICLNRNGHGTPVALQMIHGPKGARVTVNWNSPTPKMVRTYRLRSKLIEEGASGVALILARRMTGLRVVQQAVQGTGVDYWLGTEPLDDENFFAQGDARLEISGLIKGSVSEVRARLREKVQQTYQSKDSGTPAYVIIVEFGVPIAHVQVVAA